MMQGMELYRRLGRAVSERRRQLGVSQAEIAEKIGMSRASLASLETGRQRIMVHQLFALANALKLDSILDLVPPPWAPQEPLPEIRVSGGAPLNARQQSTVESFLASTFADNQQRKRSS
jgi:transcriptional regulator with XRE-family HTH domain